MANWMKLMQNQDSDYQHNMKFLRLYRETGDKDALEWLILNNANLVHKIVGSYRTFYNHKLSYDDLFSVGLEGLLRAVDKFDFAYENNFATYATYWIKQCVVRLISDEGFMIKIPTHIFETLQQIVKCEFKHKHQLTKKEICEQLKISEDKYELVQQVRSHMLKWDSLNRPISIADDTEIGELLSPHMGVTQLSTDALPVAGSTVEAEELQVAIGEGLQLLDDREQLIIIHRFGLFGAEVKTLAEIGKREGISRERIRQLESRAIRKLKGVMREYENYLNY
ncbi:MAG: sigma-70 family RNA polymerase sigma factor [Defluviitaleaceae bacterium]|nr:sigma-70 family RNA polymerase sigma factor [Defluviitaleaceae bacterium]